jgi:FKBP-type peptidyl-prolyl cis-trans isomerase
MLTARIAVALLAAASLAHAQQPSTAPAAQAPAAHAPAKSGAAKAAADETGDVSYSLGVSMGEQLRASGVTAAQVNSARLAQGVHDALGGKKEMTDADRQNIGNLLKSSYEAQGDANHRAAAKFLAENGKKDGVITTTSGLQYKVLSAGSGDSPKPSDEVTVNYRGTLLDGTEFDSSYKRGTPANLQVSRVIPGWTEALQLMKPGAKFQLFIPPQLAYDMRSRPPIPPGSMLIFDVELVSVKAPPQPSAVKPPAPASEQPPQATPPKSK